VFRAEIPDQFKSVLYIRLTFISDASPTLAAVYPLKLIAEVNCKSANFENVFAMRLMLDI
jgi:hypothetical protein